MMGEYVNYLLEANLGLFLFLFLYMILLKNETDFAIKRLTLLCGIICSITFPLVAYQPETFKPLSQLIPTIWLPEFTFQGESEPGPTTSPVASFWLVLPYLYAAGVVFSLLRFLNEVLKIAHIIRGASPVRQGGVLVAETNHPVPSFSFFNFVLLGNASGLSAADREKIIAHERVHVLRFHSLDILLINILGVFFWFNPVLRLYKNIFIQLHEFEADSRAVENHSLNDYCNLLARVALLSADLRIANHFSNSLTLKRIQMMRRIKLKIKLWKILAVAIVIPVFFFAVACNDDALSGVTEIAQDSHMALDVPNHVQERVDLLTKNNPDKKYILLEMSSTGNERLTELEKLYGLPSSMEVFKEDEEPVVARAEQGIKLKKNDNVSSQEIARSFIILEYDQNAHRLSELSREDNVFTIVDETASFPGGMAEFYTFLNKTLHYPADAKAENVEGKVFIEFVVEPDGAVTNVVVKKSLHPSIDAEAVRAMQQSPKWKAGKQNGKEVRQKMVLPVVFGIGK